MSGRLKDIQTMADMLKQGGTMTELSCPACSSPLFRLKSGQLWCVKCEKRVVIVKRGEQPMDSPDSALLTSLESTLLKKIEEINAKMEDEPASVPGQRKSCVAQEPIATATRLLKRSGREAWRGARSKRRSSGPFLRCAESHTLEWSWQRAQ